ncbi:serine/arginine repetitive matrix protein 1-like [Triplophysa dalaica]|uniref:serine/arginine repetitive matrix protein 1-like n=1 Tax=Triplophysa dalaica TaxID=1582913 RepID=UPI0024DFE50A|nr:serine/arginine repetitive matrix protein 1-like [Triplophysa dalaica]XP_056600241.1 serine/arginine repetitive matrix protein 1-like [Triplophysa dalaica]XP_056600242.1 serine/arginine repetitive matrix protein 1-like [Triplophysa dalaica]
MQNAFDQIKMTTTAASFDDFGSILPIISWADFVGDTEYDPSGVVIPSWADMSLAVMDAEVPEPSARLQRRVENPESSVRKVFIEKSVWRKQASASSDFRVMASQASESRNQPRRNNIGFLQEERMGGTKKIIKPPITTTPPSQDWRRLLPPDFVRRTERPVGDASPPQHQGPSTSSIENKVGPIQNTTPAKTVAQKQEMGDENIIIKPPITTTPPSQDWRRLLPPDFVRRTERPVGDASPPQHQGPSTSSIENKVGPIQNTTPAKTVAQKQDMGGTKKIIKPPITTTPPSQDWRRLLPPDFVRRTERPVGDASPPQHQGPSTSSIENKVGPIQNTTPAKTVAQKQEMGDENIIIKPPITTTPPSQDWRRLLPPDFVRRTERPVGDASPPQHQAPATSSIENKVGPIQNTTPAKTVAQKQEMCDENKIIKPPITTTPPSQDWRRLLPPDFVRRTERPVSDASPPQHKSLPSRLFKKSLTEAAPRRPKVYPPGFFKRLEPTDASPPQNMSLPSDFNEKLRIALKNTPLLQHQNLSSTSSKVIGVSPQEEKKNTTAKTFPQRQGRSSFRAECSLEDLCKMLDGLHLSEKPTLSLTPDSPRPLLRPASFIYKTRRTLGFSQHHTSGKEIWKNPPAPPIPVYTSEHLPAPHLNPQHTFLDDKNLYQIRKRPRLSYDI